MEWKEKKFGIITRTPNSNPKEFLTDLDLFLDKISKESKNVFLMNLNLLNNSCHHACNQFLDTPISKNDVGENGEWQLPN